MTNHQAQASRQKHQKPNQTKHPPAQINSKLTKNKQTKIRSGEDLEDGEGRVGVKGHRSKVTLTLTRLVLTSAGRVPERGRGLGQPAVNDRLQLPRQVDRGGRASACDGREGNTQHTHTLSSLHKECQEGAWSGPHLPVMTPSSEESPATFPQP